MATLELSSSLSSKDKQGKEIRARVENPVQLGDGTALPRNTVVHGVLAKTSKHTKELPNGLMELVFDRAILPGHPDLPVTVRVTKLDPQGTASSRKEATAKDLIEAKKADDEHAKKGLMTTGLPDVMLQQTKDGESVIFALGADVYLDAGVELTVQMTPSTPTAKAP